ncbi:MAG: DNA-3-methyladenine glycosylase, partial [Candidatus Eisenbacteria bacterium]|nr:DNA-3-methyladenine glycosylase [Candidatus Eisenbacteria bacterium]
RQMCIRDSTRPTGDARPAGVARSRAGGKRHADGRSWRLKVAYRPPYHWETTLAFLAARAVPGIEEVEDGAYRRSIRTDGGDGSPDGAPGGTIEVRDDTAARALAIEIRAGSSRELTRLVERVRRLFDLDADPLAIAAVLGSDPMLARSVAAHPGMRSMGAWDPFEYAIRAIIGQQVSIAAARRLAGRLVETYGTPLAWSLGTLRFLFPLPEDLARARLASIGIPQSRAEAIRKISRAVAEGLRLDASDGPELAIQRISALPGVGRWTAEMILIRGAGEPDVLPISDLGIRRAFPPDWTRARIEERSRAWSPWRSYAAMHIWRGGAEPHAAVEKRTPARQPRADKARSGHSRRRKG